MDFDEFADSYKRNVEEAIAFSGADHDFYLRIKAEFVVELAERYGGDPGALDVLDVGCGVGETHRFLEDRFGSFHGVDIAEESVARARERHPWASYHISKPRQPMPFEAGSFDLAFAVCVLHHVPPEEWEGFAKEMGRVVRPGGIVAIFEHNPYNPLTRKAINACEFDEDAVLLSRGRTRGLLREAGLELVESPYIIFFPREGPAFRSIERGLRWLPLGAQYYVASRKG